MEPGWRLRQINRDRDARERLAKGGTTGLWDWEATVLFYEIVIAVDGYAEIRGMPAPTNHKARRALVERHLPHLLDPYDDLYALSLEARYYDGYNMAESEGRRAARCREILARNVPVE